MNFQTALGRVLLHEGGYVNHPSDPGGETNYGITKRTAVNHGYTGPMRDIPSGVVADIYHKSYWQVIRGDQLPFVVAYQLFDGAVNHGPSRAVRMVQDIVGTTPDGIIGPITRQAITTHGPEYVAVRICSERLKLFASLSNFNDFGRGWTRRVASNLDYIRDDMV